MAFVEVFPWTRGGLEHFSTAVFVFFGKRVISLPDLESVGAKMRVGDDDI